MAEIIYKFHSSVPATEKDFGWQLNNFLQRKLVLFVKYNSYKDYNQDLMQFFATNFPQASRGTAFNANNVAIVFPKHKLGFHRTFFL